MRLDAVCTIPIDRKASESGADYSGQTEDSDGESRRIDEAV